MDVDMKLEAVVIPVSDVDRAKEFYTSLGWRLDADLGGDDFRIVQLTPAGSGCSIQFGRGLTATAPGSALSLLVVSDIEAAHAELVGNGVDAEVFHDARTGYNRFDPAVHCASGPDPERQSYASFAQFNDPDGNVWQLQEITTRLPGRVDAMTTSSVGERPGDRDAARLAPTASTRSAPVRRIRTGQIGTPRTWRRSRRALSFDVSGRDDRSAWSG